MTNNHFKEFKHKPDWKYAIYEYKIFFWKKKN
jgi:hypothetical protein